MVFCWLTALQYTNEFICNTNLPHYRTSGNPCIAEDNIIIDLGTTDMSLHLGLHHRSISSQMLQYKTGPAILLITYVAQNQSSVLQSRKIFSTSS